MKNIVFILTGVGGTQGLKKVRKEIELKYKNKLNLKIFTLNKIVQDYIELSRLVDLKTLFNYLKNNKPDMVVNETSNFTYIQNRVTGFLRKEGIYNVSFLDTNGNYNSRFKNVPNKIIAPSKRIRDELLKEIPIRTENVLCLGNPAFNLEFNQTPKRITNKKNKILFVSQPLKELSRQPNQFFYLKDFVKYFNNKNLNYDLAIKLHPNSDISLWDNKYKSIILDNKKFKFEDYFNYNLIIGRDSTVMMKTAQLQIPTIFYKKNKKEYNLILENKLKHNAPYLLSTKDSSKKIVNWIYNYLYNKKTLRRK